MYIYTYIDIYIYIYISIDVRMCIYLYIQEHAESLQVGVKGRRIFFRHLASGDQSEASEARPERVRGLGWSGSQAKISGLLQIALGGFPLTYYLGWSKNRLPCWLRFSFFFV